MIDILHSTACVIALYKIIEAALQLKVKYIWVINNINSTTQLGSA